MSAIEEGDEEGGEEGSGGGKGKKGKEKPKMKEKFNLHPKVGHFPLTLFLYVWGILPMLNANSLIPEFYTKGNIALI